MHSERKQNYKKPLQMALRNGMNVTWMTALINKSRPTSHLQVEVKGAVARVKGREVAFGKGSVVGGSQSKGHFHWVIRTAHSFILSAI